MVVLNFQKQFADDVDEGRKRRSIRAPRKDGRVPKKGERAHLFTGMRTKACRRLREDHADTVTRVRAVEIDHMGVKIDGRGLYGGDAPAYQGGPDAERYDGDFARADGFNSFSDMADWFAKTHGLPFHGFLIEW